MKLLATLGALALAAGSPAAEPSCRAELVVEPLAPFVEQAVRWRLRIESLTDIHTIEWLESPSFPGARAERVTIPPEAPVGPGWKVRREDRVLFPERAGPLVLPAARLACASGKARHELRIPEQRLAVRALPAAGQPPGFAGLVGPVALRRAASPTTLALGATSRVTVTLRGSGNLWAAPDPLGASDLEGAEVFARPEERRIERGGGLHVIRVLEYDVVPRRSGDLRLPALRLAWFDPETEHYTESVAPAIDLHVAERTAETAPPPGASPMTRRRDGGADVARALPHAWLWTAAKAALVLTGIGWLVFRFRGRASR